MAKATTTTANTTAAQQVPTGQAPHPYVAHALALAKATQGAHTMPQWAAMVCTRMGMPGGASAANVKRVGRYLRQQAGRNPGTGVGRGNTYAHTTGAQLAALLGYGAQATQAAPNAYTQAHNGASKVWATAKANAAKAAQARTAKQA